MAKDKPIWEVKQKERPEADEELAICLRSQKTLSYLHILQFCRVDNQTNNLDIRLLLLLIVALFFLSNFRSSWNLNSIFA